MSWQLTVFTLLALVLVLGGLWFERSRPSARVVAAVAALAALGVAGRIVLAPIPNVVATTDVVLITGYVLGGPPGFAVGALSALISNFWLGQGPWTPWQMAGWGMVGLGGALLATVSGRRLGRWGLAAAAAVAGLAYGALLDLSAMVSFGGEQSLERYLALSARAIPFNIAHAIGNAAIMLAAGPALVRIVDRYRDRFEVDWGPRPAPGSPAPAAGRGTITAGVAVLLVAAGLTTAFAGAPGRAAAGATAETAGSADAVGWLRAAQNKDGGWGISKGSSSNPSMTGWAMLGLEAAGVNPLDVRKGGRSGVDYLRSDVSDVDSTGDLERTILALRGAGLGARDFGGRDLVAQLRKRQDGNGSYDRQVNLTSFAVLARLAAGDDRKSVDKPVAWLRRVQNRNGGWGSVPGGPSEPDSTGSALQALAAVGAEKRIPAGVRWLRRSQNGDGGWSLVTGAGSNSQSTAWAIQGLLAGGASASYSKRSRSGIDYLSSRQAGDGHYAYSKASDQTPVWVTGQALAGIGRETYPIAPVARKPRDGGDGGGDDGDSGATGAGTGSGVGSGIGTGSGVGSGLSGGFASPGSGSGGPRDEVRKGGPEGAGRASGRGRERGAAEPAAETAVAAAPETDAEEEPVPKTSLPATPVLLGGLGVLALGLAGGWLLYRRNLP